MEKFDVLKDIAERTGGDIYIGVVGPVRSGKSTFIRKFMELLVLPNIRDANDRERAKDALPQAAAGLTIMTVEPKFVPDESVEISLKDNISFRVRLVDCTGYVVRGALGYEESDGQRMVLTPWVDHEIPFQEAAEIGTQKVISEHSTLGLVVTTDGSITAIPREAYVPAEERVVGELKEMGKPFIVILNTTDPFSKEASRLAGELEDKYDVSVIPVDCNNLTQDDIVLVLEQLLYEFPVREVNITLPRWIDDLEAKHWLREKFEVVVRDAVANVKRLKDVDRAVNRLSRNELIHEVSLRQMEMGTGIATIEISAREQLFFDVLGEVTGETMSDKSDLLKIMKAYSAAKQEYDKVADGLREVRDIGYGMVPPRISEMIFEEPELIRQGNRFGVRLRARAPSIHLIRADISTEVTPLIGTEKQCEELVKYLLDQFEDDPKKIWESDIFGKSLHDLMREGIQNKLYRMPENAQEKLQEALTRIVNEGGAGLICIIL
ncbi:MAG: stage IV sporulation protein A [Firmicutes bacterium]|jgi:stage IV sporulation protein A|nr:stage IV sporulation protein A [Bacillota bacterium]